MNPSAPRLLYVILDLERMDTPELESVTDRLGVMEEPLETIAAGPLAVVASPVPDRSSLVSPPVDEVLTFRSVTEAVFGAGPVVPLRFGTVAESPEHAASLVREKEATYLDLLPRLEGRVEMGISVALGETSEHAPPDDAPPDDADAEGPGTTYLRRKQQRRARERAQLEEVASPLQRAIAEQLSDVMSSTPSVSGGRVSLAFLIPRDEVERFRQTVEQVQAPGASSVVSSVDIVGPWAPYSFV